MGFGSLGLAWDYPVAAVELIQRIDDRFLVRGFCPLHLADSSAAEQQWNSCAEPEIILPVVEPIGALCHEVLGLYGPNWVSPTFHILCFQETPRCSATNTRAC